MAPKSRVVISVDSPSTVEVEVRVTTGESRKRDKSAAGSSSDRVSTKDGSANDKGLDHYEAGKAASATIPEIENEDEKMDHESSAGKASDGSQDWEKIDEDDGPRPPSHSPPRPVSPRLPPPRKENEAPHELTPEDFCMTTKSGTRLHKVHCSMLKHHANSSLAKPIHLCRNCLPLGIVSQEQKLGFSFEFPRKVHRIHDNGSCPCLGHHDRVIQPCKQCIHIA